MAHRLSRIITISALIVACTLASACGSTIGAADEDRSARQPAPSIATYTSAIDKDSDGVDDQSDILQNARAYIATKPAYKSEYYATGYPNDRYGVCTDVVGAALRGAGYDLMTLVHEDILAHPGGTRSTHLTPTSTSVASPYSTRTSPRMRSISRQTPPTWVHGRAETSSSTATTSASPPTRATQTDCPCSSTT